MLKRTKVERNDRNKQKRAGRMVFDSTKKETETYGNFGNEIQALGLAACDESLFPGNALPRAKKLKKGGHKQRIFSLFSACDFAKIVDSGFFDGWKWGDYQPYFVNRMDITHD